MLGDLSLRLGREGDGGAGGLEEKEGPFIRVWGSYFTPVPREDLSVYFFPTGLEGARKRL